MQKESTFDKVTVIILQIAEGLEKEKVKPDSHLIDNLGIDSLDLLDIVFAIDKEFDIKIPMEQWADQVNDGKVISDYYFRMDEFCRRIDELAMVATD